MTAIEVAVALGALTSPAAAQGPVPAGWADFMRTFERYVADDSIVGAGAVLVERGRVVARRDLGFADRGGGVRAGAGTLYHWGSITKTLTAVAVLQLRDRGLLSLDDPVVRWVPELRRVHNPFGPPEAVTIRMLLSHSGGFQAGTWPYGRGRPWEPFEPTEWEQLVAMMPYQEVQFAPGSRYGYSNPGFIYLARIIEAITGDAWESYIYKNVFGPLGFTRSYFNLTPWHLAGERSHNYEVQEDRGTGALTVLDGGAEFDPGITIPNGGWNAPLAEVAAWLGVLAGARGDSPLGRAAREEMQRPLVPLPAGEIGDSMGLSLFIYHRRGTRLIGHTGTQANFRSFFMLEPRSGRGIVAVVNTSNAARPEASALGFRELMTAALEALAGP